MRSRKMAITTKKNWILFYFLGWLDLDTMGSPGSLRWAGVLGGEYGSSVRTCAKMTGQRVASAQLLLTEGTLKVGFLVTRENVPLQVVPTVEARFTTRILALIVLRRRLWEVGVVWVLCPRRRRRA